MAQAAATLGQAWLILDTMPVHHRAQVVIVSPPFQRRALPLAWTRGTRGRGHGGAKQIALPARVRCWISEGVVGDGEFGSVALMRHLVDRRHRWKGFQ